ncbi:MAG: NAD+ synthase [Rubellimicrobium sp.]|nr:NAD+ synthase [Rubellimicrobium sp.]
MNDLFRLTLAQIDATMGDIAGNLARARDAWHEGRAAEADLVLVPGMFATGWPAHDLIAQPSFHRHAGAALEALAATIADGPALAIGGPFEEGGTLHEAVWVMREGRVIHRQLRHEPAPDAMKPGPIRGPVGLGGPRIGFLTAADAARPDVAETLAESGAEILCVIAADPWRRGAHDRRINDMVARVTENALPLVHLNLVGGQDEEVFDGASFVLNRGGALAALLPQFQEGIVHVDFRRTGDGRWQADPGPLATQEGALGQDYHAMVTGLGGYLRKSGIERVLLGLSGGIDSALVAALAVDTLGPGAVHAVMLPSQYTSAASREDAAGVAAALGVRLDTIPIDGPRAAVSGVLAPLFAGRAPDLTEENIQSRLRGLLLMALSNKLGGMLLTTGNKSEIAVGYATIYGDMAGGFNPIKDLWKTRVFDICRWRNACHRPWMRGPAGEVIPPRVIEKPPSAELRDNQKDEDSLPPYPVLDAILERLVEGDGSVAGCIAAGFDPATVRRVEGLLRGAEWKRRQGAPGVRLGARAFGAGRHFPVVNRWRDPAEG